MPFDHSHIRNCLEQTPATQSQREDRRAAVAMVLVGAQKPEELLFIRRAEYPGDPWSGDVAFPGGGVEKQDTSSRATAERETHEEIGLKLPEESYLGSLGAIRGDFLPIQISCHIYYLNSLPQLEPNHEVVDIFRVPLPVLLEPERNRERRFEYRNSHRTHPIIDLDGYCDRFLWGISYRLLQKFFTRLGLEVLR